MNKNINFTGFHKSPLDLRDYSYTSVRGVETKTVLPVRYSTQCTEVRDQGGSGTCVGMATAVAQETDEMLNGCMEHLSSLFVYRECKKVDGLNQEGTYPRTAMQILKDKGVCLETLYPYKDDDNIRKLRFPSVSTQAYNDAKTRKIKNYARLYTLTAVKEAIYNENAIVLGTFVTDSFMKSKNGVIGSPMGKIYGGHAISAVGWDDEIELIFDPSDVYGCEDKTPKKYRGGIKIKNSWGTQWGQAGYGWIPYDVFDIEVMQEFYYNLINEAWTSVGNLNPDADLDFHKRQNTTEPGYRKLIKMTIGNVEATVNDEKFVLPTAPVVISGSTMIPLRFLSQALGYKVDYVNSTKKITVNDMVMYIGKKEATVNGTTMSMPVAPTLVNNTTVVPLRFICEYFKCIVDYDNLTKSITIIQQ